jgi:hypothetical protein
VQLPRTCQLPDDRVFYITDVCIPHSWKTVEEGVTDTLYLLRVNQQGALTSFEGYVVRLAPSNYTLTTFAEELQTRLRENTGSPTFTVVVNTGLGSSGITIQNTDQSYIWKLLTDDDLIRKAYPTVSITYDSSNLRSANDIIRNIESDDVLIGGIGSNNRTYETGFLNLNWINNIYISSPNLGAFDTIFAGNGATNIIKKVPVLVNYGFQIVDQLLNPSEALDCSKQTLQTLEFHLKTSRGQYVPLHGAHVSFSIVFNKL